MSLRSTLSVGWSWPSSPTRQKDNQANTLKDQHWQQRAPTLRKGWGPKWYTYSNHCFLIIIPWQTPKEEAKLFLLDTSFPAFVIKDYVVTMLIYLRAKIIFAFGKLHPLAGKLQPSLWELSTSTVVMLFSLIKQKEIVVFLLFCVCSCVGRCWIKIFCLFILVCFLPARTILCVSSSLCLFIPTPNLHCLPVISSVVEPDCSMALDCHCAVHL